MQDITLRKVTPSPESKAEVVSDTAFHPVKSAFLVTCVQIGLGIGRVLGRVVSRVAAPTDSQAVVRPAIQPSLSSSSNLPRRERYTPKTTAHRFQTQATTAGRHIRKKVAKAAHGAKTPIGKLALVQTAAVLALFTYVVHSNKNSISLATQDQNARAAGQNTIRTFLPTAADYTTPKVFEEGSVAAQGNQLPLQAWATPWNLTSLTQNHALYKEVSAFWETVSVDGSHLEDKADWQQWNTFAASKGEGQKYFLTITGNPNATYLTISDPQLRTAFINQFLGEVQKHGFDGGDIDFEGLGRENQDLFTQFVQQAAAAFHEQGKLLTVTVETRLANQVPMNWHALGEAADELRVMAYDYHSKQTDQPGPIAPIGWLKEILDYAQQNVDPAKLVIGLGNYGYDWTEPDDPSASWQGTGVSFDEAMAIAKEHQASIIRISQIDDRGYDTGSVPAFVYKDDQGRQHSVFFEDSSSLQAKINLVSQYHTAGVIFWSVGQGDSDFWQSTTAK